MWGETEAEASKGTTVISRRLKNCDEGMAGGKDALVVTKEAFARDGDDKIVSR